MQQSLLAILGLMVATIFSFSVTEKSLHYQRAAIVQEIEEMGASMALKTMEIIRERPFESEILTPSDSLLAPLDPEVATLAELKTRLALVLPDGKACSVFGTGLDDCADISDFNKMQTATLPFVAGTDTLYFNVDVTVRYVDAGMNASGPSFRKQVTVLVEDYWPQNGRSGHYIPTPITLSRVMTLTL